MLRHGENWDKKITNNVYNNVEIRLKKQNFSHIIMNLILKIIIFTLTDH